MPVAPESDGGAAVASARERRASSRRERPRRTGSGRSGAPAIGGRAARLPERPVAPPCRLLPHPCSRCGRLVPLIGRPMCAGRRVHPVRALREELAHGGQLEERGRRPRARTARIGVGARGQQPGDALGRLPEDRGGQRRLAAVVGARVVGAAVQQRGDGVRVPVVGGQDQQRVALVVGEVDRHAGVDVRDEVVGAAAAGEVEDATGQLDDARVDRFGDRHVAGPGAVSRRRRRRLDARARGGQRPERRAPGHRRATRSVSASTCCQASAHASAQSPNARSKKECGAPS